LIIRCATAYNTISLAIYGTIFTVDIPRPHPYPQQFTFPQTPSVEDMLSGVAWKDIKSSSVGGVGPYIPKVLLGIVDSEEEREARRQFYREKKRDEQIKSCIAAIKMLRKEGMISAVVATELESKVHDNDGFCPLETILTEAFMSQVVPILCTGMSS
jgi:hypothetical protein